MVGGDFLFGPPDPSCCSSWPPAPPQFFLSPPLGAAAYAGPMLDPTGLPLSSASQAAALFGGFPAPLPPPLAALLPQQDGTLDCLPNYHPDFVGCDEYGVEMLPLWGLPVMPPGHMAQGHKAAPSDGGEGLLQSRVLMLEREITDMKMRRSNRDSHQFSTARTGAPYSEPTSRTSRSRDIDVSSPLPGGVPLYGPKAPPSHGSEEELEGGWPSQIENHLSQLHRSHMTCAHDLSETINAARKGSIELREQTRHYTMLLEREERQAETDTAAMDARTPRTV